MTLLDAGEMNGDAISTRWLSTGFLNSASREGMRLAAAAMPSTSALFMNTTRTRPTISDRWLGLKRNADWRAEAVVLFRL